MNPPLAGYVMLVFFAAACILIGKALAWWHGQPAH